MTKMLPTIPPPLSACVGLALCSALLFCAAPPRASAGPADTTGSGSSAATASQPENVPFFRGGPERTGFVDTDVILPLSVAWQNTTTALSQNASAPVIDSGMVFFASGNRLYAVNAVDGSTTWAFPALGPPNPDVQTPKYFRGQAAVADGKVFIGNDDGYLYVLDEKTGSDLWNVKTGGAVRSAPVIDQGVVFFGSVDTKLYAIRVDNQKPVWGGEFQTTGPVISPPVISGGWVYFSDANDNLYAASESTGRLAWSERFQNGIGVSPPLFADGTVIVGSDRQIFGIAPGVGAQRWHVDLPGGLTSTIAANSSGNEFYAATDDDHIVAISTNGKVLWKTLVDSVVDAPISACDNMVIAATRSGIITALDPSNGAIKWTYSIHGITPPRKVTYANDSYITAAPLIANGSLYVLGNDGTLTGLTATAADGLPPDATLEYPTTTKAIAGYQVSYRIKLTDAGSGIDPRTIVLKVDGTTLPTEYVPGQDLVQIKRTGEGTLFGTVPAKLDTLRSGGHTLKMVASDWRGNQLTQSWHFSVNSKLNPAGAPLPPAESSAASQPDSGAQTPPDASADQAANGNSQPGGDGSSAGGATANAIAGGSTSPSSGSSGGGGTATAGGGGTVSGGGTPVTGPTQPTTPINPPPNAGSSFPPPPPI